MSRGQRSVGGGQEEGEDGFSLHSAHRPLPTAHFQSPAKINLDLRVGPPRADGFHPIRSWFVKIGLFDTLTFEPADQISLTCDVPTIPTDSKNLVWRAAELVGGGRGVAIHLAKQIPAGGGLGGGSSNAATTLMALNKLWNLGHSTEKLAELGATLGSDVPFFLHGPSSICEGRGEIITPTPAPVMKWVVLILPGIHMSTPAVFKRLDELRSFPPPLEGGGRGRGPQRRIGRKRPHDSHLDATAARLRRDMTWPEKRIWARVRAKRADLRFRRQQPIGPYVVDFYCASAKLIVELDGLSHAFTQEEDAKRQSWLEAQGYRVIRFTNNEALKEPDAVVETILLNCTDEGRSRGNGRGGPLPLPPPSRGGGIEDVFVNDLELPAFDLSPQLAALRQTAETAIGQPVRMSGSGSTLFSLFDNRFHAGAAAVKLGRICGVRTLVCDILSV